MKHTRVCAFLGLGSLFFAATLQAVQRVEPSASARHGERLVKFSGAL